MGTDMRMGRGSSGRTEKDEHGAELALVARADNPGRAIDDGDELGIIGSLPVRAPRCPREGASRSGALRRTDGSEGFRQATGGAGRFEAAQQYARCPIHGCWVV